MPVDISEFEFLEAGGTTLVARMFRPRGEGPFPAVVDLHGGAWVMGHRSGNDTINRLLAEHGIVVMAIDYRVPPQGTYPCSVQDANFAVRWLKANAARHGTEASKVGLIGTSSGGHLAVLAAIKPDDERYKALPMAADVDARVRHCVALWPVICPWARYRDVVLAAEAGDLSHREGANPRQMTYWLTEDAMREGSPEQAVHRGDPIDLPPILYVQSPTDTLHPYPSARDFVRGYRERGGEVEMHLVDGEPYNLVRTQPESAESKRAIARMAAFIHERSR